MIREADKNDLSQLLTLYTSLHDNSLPKEDAKLKKLWLEVISDPNHHIIVAEKQGEIISSCVCVIIPNFTNNCRPYALIENVITDPTFRGQSLATSCLNYAKDIAIKENCYKIMLLTSSKDESTLEFYENAGYNSQDKTAFIKWL